MWGSPPLRNYVRGVGRDGQRWPGVVRRRLREVGGPILRDPHRRAKTIESISRIQMVVSRASGTLMASSLKQNTFLTLGVRPAGDPRGTGGPGGARDGGTRGGPGRGTREGQFKSTFPCGGTSLADPEGVKAI